MPLTADDPIRVLFLCTGNSARSQMAEAFLQRRGGGRFWVASAGTHPTAQVHPEAVALLARSGIDWSGRRPKALDEVIGEPWDLVITVCDRAKESCPIFPGRPHFAHWGIPDPAAVEDDAERAKAFASAAAILIWRMDLMLALRPEVMRSLVVEQRLQAIGKLLPPDQSAAPVTDDARAHA